ncbi:MAG: alkaline phosphatase family protein [Hydrogenophaga sp.]|uniref:alkaline phosphatase family protein n=1 Tax=Hydrogenophaga sp. TaxID=1904254 RepID=UPI0016951FF6|nr:alkaline phosphatase family protein [Hydrogenophaga sp.]NIM40441.1 alkaline phosphatase family protein [Hydrogenophaga sp.]NIN25859.1 alkaline phosphatase family protein [Hydrogenophaga sp.]NIN30731.1 alkaline phosphatase family protein [Hydrogenophaga sp.]NIN54824.1 alkaline phosphatase family protein [Hydrogenophaga sp.]NIO50864.1 alkaline phosphatase family protein [Hydrogenophaga sp.]
MTEASPDKLPPVLAGPVLRRVQARRIAWWIACSHAPAQVRVSLLPDGGAPSTHSPTVHTLRAGEHLALLLIELELDTDLTAGLWTGYRFEFADAAGGWTPLDDPALCYPGRDTPGLRFAPGVRALLHGSCRKPHHAGGGDGLARADTHLDHLLRDAANDITQWPSALVLSGDQVYCDDVAGPMLRAIHGLMQRLGLREEAIAGADGSEVRGTSDLLAHPDTYYRREQLLPRTPRSERLIDLVFEGVKKPIFTTDNAHNHLITLGEVLAMYLLVWSPLPWRGLDLSPPPGLSDENAERYAREARAIHDFRQGLGAARRVLAHLPVAMVFDDHDVTDDWNLSREWEDVAYGHPFSRRVIGNALIAYLLNQGWGNRPEAFGGAALLDAVQAALDEPGGTAHDALIERLLHWRDWHYVWPTTPPLMVLDSRTHRWRSDRSPRRPSGLMDWEALTDLQQALRGHPAVLLVASAPIFGVKLIETVQRIFSFFGHPLLVDAENWMSHPGAASAMLNIFRHPKTPQTFVVLSGDVHYSFVYDVALRPRGRRQSPLADPAPSPHIWQICSSGLRNTFPEGLLEKLDHLNRWLFSPRSPLNRFTRRRHMKVTPRKPEGTPHGRRLLNGAGIGLVHFDERGAPVRIRQLLSDGREVDFVPREAEARED